MNDKFVPHDNFSDDVNLNIMRSEKSGGLNLDNVQVGQSFNVQTLNTLYHFTKTKDDEYEVSGHPRHCPFPTLCHIHGSTWGGSLIKIKFVGMGMQLEIYLTPMGKQILTSEIQNIELV